MEDSDGEAEDVSVKADPPKAAPSRQTQASKQRRKKKKGKADLLDKSIQSEPARVEEDLDQLLTELNIKLVRLHLALFMHPSGQLNPPAQSQSSQCTVSVMRLTTTVRCAIERT